MDYYYFLSFFDPLDLGFNISFFCHDNSWVAFAFTSYPCALQRAI